MRKAILKEEKKETFDPEDANPRLYYGALISGEKGFISRVNFEYGSFRVLCRNQITNGNKWLQFQGNSLAGLIESIAKDQNEVYEFDSSKELFRWLAED